MSEPHDLAAIVNSVREDDLGGIALDDLLVLLAGLRELAGRPDVKAARRRLAAVILSKTDGAGKAFPAAGTCTDPLRPKVLRAAPLTC